MTRQAETFSSVVVVALFLIFCSLFSLAGTAWAADTPLFTRQNYDLVMRWVNFFILAAVFLKFGRKPLIWFLDNQQKDISRSIEDLEAKKQEAEALVVKSRSQLEDSRERLARIREKIVAEGQRRKEQLIVDAQNDARNMINSAQNKIHGQMKTAYANIKAELVDMAADMALAKLPTLMTPQDQEQWVRHWIQSAENQVSAVK